MSTQLPTTFSIDGNSYSRTDLRDLCKEFGLRPAEAEWKREVFAFIDWFLNSGDLDMVQLTSGTTGTPKEVRLSREAMQSSAQKTLETLNLRAGQSALLCLPIRYIAGKMMVVRALVGGLNLILQNPSGRPLAGISKEVTFAAMVPLQVHDSLLHGDPLSLLSKLLIGGGELHDNLRKELVKRDMPEAYLSFGMTETCTHFALQRINGDHADKGFKALAGVKLSQDDRACLVVDVPGITQGPVITNDLVDMDESAQAFTWLGRYDHVINTGGIKVIPEWVEQKASICTGKECLLLSEPDPKLGEKLVLMVESKEDDPPIDQWLSCLRQSLSTFEVPKRIVTVVQMPRNNSLKPDRTSAHRLLL